MHFIEYIKPKLPEPIYIKYFYGDEALSYGFNYHITVLTQNTYDTIKSLLGKQLQFIIQTKQYKRYFNGILIQVTELNIQHYHRFKLLLISPIQLLRFNKGCYIYKKISLKTLLSKLFAQHNLGEITFKADTNNMNVDFDTQYNETTYHFIRRLLAQNRLLFYYKHNASGSQIYVIDIPFISSQQKHTYLQSNLMHCNYQFFNQQPNSCYSNYPHIELTIPIGQEYYIHQIKHHATNSAFLLNESQQNEAQGYIQYLKFKPADKLITSLKIPTTKGIQLGHIRSSDLHAQPSWDYKKELTHALQSQCNIPFINFKPTVGQTVIIAYQKHNPNKPYIIGTIYGKKNLSPQIYSHHARSIGIQDVYKNSLMIYPDQKESFYFSAQNNLFFSAQKSISITSNIDLKSNHSLTLDTDRSLLLYSETLIHIGNAKNYIIIKPYKITLKGIKIHFNTQ